MALVAINADQLRFVAKARALRWPRSLLISALSPLVLSLAFPRVDWGLAAFVALPPLFVLWARLPWKQAFLWGWFSGALFFALQFHWMTNTLLSFVGPWSWLALLILCALEGSTIALTALLASLIGRGAFQPASIVAVPAAWLICESVRTSGSLGVPFGQLGFIATHISWLLPVAAYGGVYLLTLVVALLSAAIAGIVAGTPPVRTAGALVLAVVALLILIANLGSVRFEQPTVRVAVAQAAIAQQLKWSPATFTYTMQTYDQLTRAAAKRGAKLIVWPETAITSFPLQDRALRKQLESLARSAHTWIIAGTIDRPSSAGYYNALVEFTPSGSVGGIYHKRWLLPFAEYLPFDNLLRRFALMDDASDFLRGPGPHLLSAAGFRWGSMICYESAFPSYARANANAGADALIVATNDDWFIGTAEPYAHADVVKIQAVATGRWIVRAAQSGISEIVDPHGNVTQRIGMGEQNFIVGGIGKGKRTVYDRLGNAWLLALCLVTLAWGLVSASSIKRRLASRYQFPRRPPLGHH